MPNKPFEVRICQSCGMRYPLMEGQEFGVRCPACLGETRVALRKVVSTESERFLSPASFPQRRMAVLLDNVRSAWNAGSILRSADGFGFSQAYLCGITPTPDQEAVTKTSLGAEDSVPWSYHKDAVKLVKGLTRMGHRIYALEEHERATDITLVPGVPDNSILIVGNEVTGVDPELLEICDRIFYIPMRGEKRSFNVAIAFSIAAYAFNSERWTHH